MSRLSPLKIFLIYWVFTLFLYAFGPYSWVTYKPLLFWTLVILFMISFTIGWISGGILSSNKGRIIWNKNDDKVLLKKLGYLLYINLFYEIVNLFRGLLLSSFSIKNLVSSIANGIVNMGSSYGAFVTGGQGTEGANIAGGYFITIFNYVWDIWGFSTFLFSILYFKKLNGIQKLLACFTILIVVIQFISKGTNIGIFRIVLAFLVFYYIKCLASKPKRVKPKNNSSFIIIAILGVVIVLSLFNKIMVSRGGINAWEMEYFNVGGIHVNKRSVFFKILPSGFHKLLVSLSGYLCQGYYGMSLTLRVPWKPNYGIGYSMWLENFLSNFFPSIIDNTYQMRIEQFGWNSFINWHSMYSWFANDVSYYGVIIIMFLLGFLFRKALIDAKELNNPYAKLMVYFMFLMLIFAPCNNQLGQSPYTLFSFYYVFFKWQLSKRRFSVRFR